MAKNLMIVESPAKAKTIEKYLGKDFKVKSSFGHIRDLEKGNNAIDIKNGFEPKYIISPEKVRTVKDLKEAAKQAEEIWLATDEDREGEAISWHLCSVLGLDPKVTKRIVFREITKPAIQKAIQSPRTVDLNLVNAQQARRVLDRLVGFELSETLWRKIRGKLSAGRVQSVAVKLVAEREREITAFNAEAFFKIQAVFKVKDSSGRVYDLKAELPDRIDTKPAARKWIDACINAKFNVDTIEIKPATRKPAPPFTTSTLQQEASRKLGFSVKRTMSCAQKLYESGYISYMRTDSVSLSETAQQGILGQIRKEFGEQYAQPRQYASKNASAQEAHEAIRPSYPENPTIQDGDRDMQRLYELIWKRAVASQMADAKLERTQVTIAVSSHPGEFMMAKGEVIKFDGFLKLYIENQDDEPEEEGSTILPPLKEGQPLDLNEMTGVERYTKPPARYTEAGLVKKLEELGIGRPSTYAPTISKIMEDDRGYVVKENRPGTERAYAVITLSDSKVTEETKTEMTGAVSNRLIPTDMGLLVTDFLNDNFAKVMDYNFTADIEKQFDIIAEGDLVWNKMIEAFYIPFHQTVEETLDTAGKVKGRRDLGFDPETGLTVLTQMTRFGPVVQIGTREEMGEGDKPRFANLRPGQSIETISMAEAMDLFQLPRKLKNYKGQEVLINAGRFGPYVKFGEAFISIPKDEDPMTITEKRVHEVIDAKLHEDRPVSTYKGSPISKGKGRFGPFLKWEGVFVNIPKKYDPETLTEPEMHELLAAKLDKEANRFIQQWDKEKIAIENGRWGPFIRKGKKAIAFPRIEGEKITPEIAAELTIEEVKELIEGGIPDSVAKKINPAFVGSGAAKVVKSAAKPAVKSAAKTAKKPVAKSSSKKAVKKATKK
jgi:DNA topoisomerase-1